MRILIGAVLLLLLSSLTLAQAPQALVVIVADQHSAYERTAQVVAAIDRLTATLPGVPLAILIDGDALENGNAVARRSSGAVDFAMFTAFAKRAPTVVNLGNHEMEFNDLAATVARITASGAHVISNLTDRTTNRLAAPHVGQVSARRDGRGGRWSGHRQSVDVSAGPTPVARCTGAGRVGAPPFCGSARRRACVDRAQPRGAER